MFEVDSPEARTNALHKLDTLISALRVFRTGLEAEFEHYERREQDLNDLGNE